MLTHIEKTMRKVKVLLFILLLALLAAALAWLGQIPGRTPTTASQPQTQTQAAPLRLGLVPERDIYQQHRAFRALADYLSQKTGRPVELVTNNSYVGVLDDFREARIDFAFLGSLVAALAVDRYDARVLAKTQYPGQISTYSGVIFVPEDSPIQSITDLRGRKVGAVQSTLAGAVFPIYRFREDKLLGTPDAPILTWAGTHDDVIREVFAGQLDAGCVKNIRLNAYLAAHPQIRVRRLATSIEVPENTLVVRRGISEQETRRIWLALQEMSYSITGREALKALGVSRFLPCEIEQFRGLYDMVDDLGSDWPLVGVEGPPPQRPAPLKSPSSPGGS